MDNQIIKIDEKNILLTFNVGEKKYCALKDPNEEDVYFALVSPTGEGNFVLTNVFETEMDSVVSEYDKIINFLESEDELDSEEEDV